MSLMQKCNSTAALRFHRAGGSALLRPRNFPILVGLVSFAHRRTWRIHPELRLAYARSRTVNVLPQLNTTVSLGRFDIRCDYLSRRTELEPADRS